MKKRLLLSLGVLLLSSCVFFPQKYPFDRGVRDTFNQGLVAFDAGLYKDALTDLQKSANKGNVNGQYLTGLIYLKGLAGRMNIYQAEKFFAMAAAEGHVASQIQLAFLYADKTTLMYNPEQAYRWFAIVCKKRPDYRPQLDRVRWAVQDKTVFSRYEQEAKNHPYFSDGIDYNDLFPPRI